MDADAEKNLVASSRAGDREAYAGLVRAHCGRVFAVCFGMLGNRHDAEDAAQQTFLSGLLHIRSLRHNDRFGPWVAQIARNLCLDVIRRRRHQVLPPTDFGDERTDPDDGHRLEAALGRLSEDYRVPLLLFYCDGRSTAGIAETLGVSQATIQTRLSRARKQLREMLAAEGDEP